LLENKGLRIRNQELGINVFKLREYSLGVSRKAKLLTQNPVAARVASDISPGLWPKESISAITILNLLTILMLKVS